MGLGLRFGLGLGLAAYRRWALARLDTGLAHSRRQQLEEGSVGGIAIVAQWLDDDWPIGR